MPLVGPGYLCSILALSLAFPGWSVMVPGLFLAFHGPSLAVLGPWSIDVPDMSYLSLSCLICPWSGLLISVLLLNVPSLSDISLVTLVIVRNARNVFSFHLFF